MTRRDDLHVGTVKDILLDGGGWPRYLDVDAVAVGKRILVPLERSAAEPAAERVWVRGMTAERFHALPSYAGDPEHLGEAYETRLLDDWHRGTQGPGADPARGSSLVRLSEVDEYRVSGDSRDVRGWKVVLGDGRGLGEVAELLFDPDEMRVRYLDCDVDEDALDLERVDRHVLLPVEQVRLESGDRHVVVEGLFSGDVGGYPVYAGLPLSEDQAERIRHHFRPRRDPSDVHVRSAARGFFRPRGRGRGRARAQAGVAEAAEKAERSERAERAREGVPRGEASPSAPHREGEERAGGEVIRRRTADGEEVTVTGQDGRNVRIRITGDDIVIEKGGTGEVQRD